MLGTRRDFRKRQDNLNHSTNNFCFSIRKPAVLWETAILILVLLFSMTFASAQVSTEKMDAIFKQFSDSRQPGCALLVLRNGKRVFRKSYGASELRTYQAIGPETNFRLASLTKQFTAMAIMLLAHDGKLKYEDRLTDVFEDFPAYGKAITIRQMLNHTSGLLDYEDLMEKQHPVVPDDKIPQIKDAEVLGLLKQQTTTKFAPGSHWDYSNSGYVLLGLVVEKRSGKSFGDFLRERIFLPLGMTNTIAYENGKNEVAHRAFGHSFISGAWHQTDQSSTSATLGDGGVYTSLEDIEKWDRGLTQHTLLTESEMAPALVAPTPSLQTLDGRPAPLYGFGWFLDPFHGHPRYSHYGETRGFRTAIQRFPQDQLTVVVLSNRSETDSPALAEQVAQTYLRNGK